MLLTSDKLHKVTSRYTELETLYEVIEKYDQNKDFKKEMSVLTLGKNN